MFLKNTMEEDEEEEEVVISTMDQFSSFHALNNGSTLQYSGT